MDPLGSNWHVAGGCEPRMQPTPTRREGLSVNPLTSLLGIRRHVDAPCGRLPSWPILVGVDMGVPYRFVPVVMRPSNWYSLELAVSLVHYVGVHHRHLVPPQEQRPPPLDVPLKAHDPINESKLVSDIVVIHLVVIVVRQIPPQEGEVDSLLEGRAPNLLHDWCPGDALARVQDHVEGLLVVAWCYDQIGRSAVPLQHRRLDGAPCCVGGPPRLVLLYHIRRTASTTLAQNSVDQNRVRQRVRGLCKFHGIEKVIHLAPVTRLTQVLKHVDQPAVHRAVALCKEVRFNRFIPKVKVPCVAVVGDAVANDMVSEKRVIPARLRV
jgi:hypothetical protein